MDEVLSLKAFFMMCNFCYRLLHLRTANCKFNGAKDTFREAVDVASKMTSKNELDINMAVLYGEKCGLLFALSDYEEVNKGYLVYVVHFCLGSGKSR